MTIVEVLVAITILTGATLGMAAFVARFAKASGQSRVRDIAVMLAADRLEDVKEVTTYTAIDTCAQLESPVSGYPTFTRQTFVQRIGGGSSTVDYKIVTVDVTAPGLQNPVRKTTIISNF